MLASISGLQNLISVGGDMQVSFSSLENLNGLNNLKRIGGTLDITFNSSLKSLVGLENLEANSIEELYLYYNSDLTDCAVQAICDYLVDPTGNYYVYNNAPGCDSPEEVEEACETVDIVDHHFEYRFTIHPNPTSDQFIIGGIKGMEIEQVNIYNQLGQSVMNLQQVEDAIDISSLQEGMYVVEVKFNKTEFRTKLIIYCR
jgi:hypothetical protein